MEDRTQLTVNGQELQQSDVNNLGKVSALADDRVLAELLRLAPFSGTVARAVTGFGYKGLPSTLAGLVRPAGNSGAVCVNAFRAVVGSRGTVAGIGAKDNWRDIRSGVFTNATGLTNDPTVPLAANASGNPRWDLIYATLAVDANGPSVTRYVKNPTTLSTAANSLVSTLVSSVTVGVVAGTPSATPVRPATPADSGSSYVIPLAYVAVPSGFGATSAILKGHIHIIAPVAGISGHAGGHALRPASSQNVLAQMDPSGLANWAATAGYSPADYLPSDLTGALDLLISVDLLRPNGAVVDDSIDWTNRFFRWQATLAKGGVCDYPTNVAFAYGTNISQISPSPRPEAHMSGMGASFGNSAAANQSFVAYMLTTTTGAGGTFVTSTYSPAAAASAFGLYVDRTTGNLRWYTDGANTSGKVFIWLTATGHYSNA